MHLFCPSNVIINLAVQGPLLALRVRHPLHQNKTIFGEQQQQCEKTSNTEVEEERKKKCHSHCTQQRKMMTTPPPSVILFTRAPLDTIEMHTLPDQTQPPLARHPRAQQSSEPRQGQYFPSCRTVLFTTVSAQVPAMHPVALVSEDRGKKT